ncbi:MAG: DUF1016 family protein [Phaeodactylibacter sp.]|nr:DUF1016 family protein [Phaeodactylibacter sp.]
MQPARPGAYRQLLDQISARFREGQSAAARAVNVQLLETYWAIGQYIVEFEQGGEATAKYGKNLLEDLSKDLKALHGNGFSRSNINYMRLLYLRYPNCETLSHNLSWSHYVELLKIDDALERSFYEKQSIFVLIDLKREEAGYQDVGQMNMYLGYFEEEESTEGDNPPIGIVLAREKDELLIKYALHGISSQLFVNRYQLYLPNREELRAEVERIYEEE